jgi:DHA1 family multidrug resistance protein-like MFS transporter
MFALFIESKLVSKEYIATIAGSIFAVMGLFQVISSPLWGKRNDRIGIRKNLTYAMLGAGIGYAAHIAASGVWELIPIRAFLGFCIGGVLPSLYTFISKNSPEDRKGGVMGIASSFTLLGNLLGPISSGYIAAFTSIDFIFVLSGLLLALGAVFVYFNIRKPVTVKVVEFKEMEKGHQFIEQI